MDNQVRKNKLLNRLLNDIQNEFELRAFNNVEMDNDKYVIFNLSLRKELFNLLDVETMINMLKAYDCPLSDCTIEGDRVSIKMFL